jgi:hypothetical protein
MGQGKGHFILSDGILDVDHLRILKEDEIYTAKGKMMVFKDDPELDFNITGQGSSIDLAGSFMKDIEKTKANFSISAKIEGTVSDPKVSGNYIYLLEN